MMFHDVPWPCDVELGFDGFQCLVLRACAPMPAVTSSADRFGYSWVIGFITNALRDDATTLESVTRSDAAQKARGSNWIELLPRPARQRVTVARGLASNGLPVRRSVRA